MRRVLAALALVALSAWPVRDAIVRGEVAGAGPDVASTMWAMWWFSLEWAGPAWGGHTTLVNFPAGALGGVLSPVTATLWALLAPVVGDAAATTWTDVLYLGAFAASVAWLGRETGLGRAGALLAGALVLAPRYPLFAMGETSIVGITALTVSVGLVATLKVARGGRWGWAALLAACVGVTGVEMPYLAPVLPVAVGLAWLRTRRQLLLAGLGAGWGLLMAIGAMHGATQDEAFGLMRSPETVGFGAWRWVVVEAPWARSAVGNLLFPGEVRWSLDATASEAATGRDYLGLSLVAMAGVALAARRAVGAWVALALAGVVLATGSDWFGLPSPFALMNALARDLVRGLTQPTRFLMLPTIGLAVAAAHGVEVLAERRRAAGIAAVAVLAVDAFAFGGLSLRLPTMTLPRPDCVVALRDRDPGTGVLVWPWDGLEHAEGSVRRRLLQVAHQHPGALFGVGSWKLLGAVPTGVRLQRLGWADAVAGKRRLNTGPLLTLGYRWVVADEAAGPAAMASAAYNFGAPTETCAGAAVYRLAAPISGAGP
jgi:hypothetical protein